MLHKHHCTVEDPFLWYLPTFRSQGTLRQTAGVVDGHLTE